MPLEPRLDLQLSFLPTSSSPEGAAGYKWHNTMLGPTVLRSKSGSQEADKQLSAANTHLTVVHSWASAAHAVSPGSPQWAHPAVVSAVVTHVDDSWENNITPHLKSSISLCHLHLKMVWFLEGLPEFSL